MYWSEIFFLLILLLWSVVTLTRVRMTQTIIPLYGLPTQLGFFLFYILLFSKTVFLFVVFGDLDLGWRDPNYNTGLCFHMFYLYIKFVLFGGYLSFTKRIVRGVINVRVFVYTSM